MAHVHRGPREAEEGREAEGSFTGLAGGSSSFKGTPEIVAFPGLPSISILFRDPNLFRKPSKTLGNLNPVGFPLKPHQDVYLQKKKQRQNWSIDPFAIRCFCVVSLNTPNSPVPNLIFDPLNPKLAKAATYLQMGFPSGNLIPHSPILLLDPGFPHACSLAGCMCLFQGSLDSPKQVATYWWCPLKRSPLLDVPRREVARKPCDQVKGPLVYPKNL